MEQYKSRQARLDAVLSREDEADGVFVYGVVTTGIYCRPSCPSPRPKVENIALFDVWPEAEANGFRACKRCAPDELGVRDDLITKVTAACRLIEDEESEMPNLDALARAVSLSPFHFHRIFKDITGCTPNQYRTACKVKRFRDQSGADANVTNAVFDAGFASVGAAYRTLNSRLGMKPATYLRGGTGERITYGLAESRFGVMLVASTERGLCALLFAEDEPALVADLKRRFPEAELKRGDQDFSVWINRALQFVACPDGLWDLPVDIRGTAFQESVWRLLCEIPLGETRSYREVAEAIGKPRAVRAVASACAANPTALVVPCHRVLRSDGGLGGYRWGEARKRDILQHEQDLFQEGKGE